MHRALLMATCIVVVLTIYIVGFITTIFMCTSYLRACRVPEPIIANYLRSLNMPLLFLLFILEALYLALLVVILLPLHQPES